MLGGGCAGPAFAPTLFLLGGLGAAKGLLPCFLVPKGHQPAACTLALWRLKFGPTDSRFGEGRQKIFNNVRDCLPAKRLDYV